MLVKTYIQAQINQAGEVPWTPGKITPFQCCAFNDKTLELKTKKEVNQLYNLII